MNVQLFILFIFSTASVFGRVCCTSIDQLNLGNINAACTVLPSLIWDFHQKKLITEPHDYFVFSNRDVHRQETILQAINEGVLEDVLPNVTFFLDKNGRPLAYKLPKTISLYPTIPLETHLLKAIKDTEYTDSKAFENLVIRLKSVIDNSEFRFVNLTIDKVGIFENRCYLIDLDCIIKLSEFKCFKNRRNWLYLKELYSYDQLNEKANEAL